MEEWDDLLTCLRPGQHDLSLRKTSFKSRAIKMKAERIPQNITSVGYAFLLQASKSTASNYCSFTSLLQLMSIDFMLDCWSKWLAALQWTAALRDDTAWSKTSSGPCRVKLRKNVFISTGTVCLAEQKQNLSSNLFLMRSPCSLKCALLDVYDWSFYWR